jgi:hypothetical protein
LHEGQLPLQPLPPERAEAIARRILEIAKARWNELGLEAKNEPPGHPDWGPHCFQY